MMATLGTACDMPAKCLGSAGFYCRHHLELIETDMPFIGSSPCRTISSEDIGYLQFWPGSCFSLLLLVLSKGFLLKNSDLFVGADRALDCLGRHLRVASRGRQFGVTEQNLNDPHICICLQ